MNETKRGLVITSLNMHQGNIISCSNEIRMALNEVHANPYRFLCMAGFAKGPGLIQPCLRPQDFIFRQGFHRRYVYADMSTMQK